MMVLYTDALDMLSYVNNYFRKRKYIISGRANQKSRQFAMVTSHVNFSLILFCLETQDRLVSYNFQSNF